MSLRTQWFGLREFAIQDPDGYVITFAERSPNRQDKFEGVRLSSIIEKSPLHQLLCPEGRVSQLLVKSPVTSIVVALRLYRSGHNKFEGVSEFFPYRPVFFPQITAELPVIRSSRAAT